MLLRTFENTSLQADSELLPSDVSAASICIRRPDAVDTTFSVSGRLESYQLQLVFRMLVVIVALACLASCGYDKNNEAATKAVDTFHQQFNDSKFKEIYVTAAPFYRGAGNEADHERFLRFVRSKLGAFKSSAQNGWMINFAANERTIEITFNSNFEHGAAVETFSFFVSGEIAVLRTYNINLPAAFITQ